MVLDFMRPVDSKFKVGPGLDACLIFENFEARFKVGFGFQLFPKKKL
jgi:hypothetical protein